MMKIIGRGSMMMNDSGNNSWEIRWRGIGREERVKRDTGEKQNQNYLNGQRRGGGVKEGMGRE